MGRDCHVNIFVGKVSKETMENQVHGQHSSGTGNELIFIPDQASTIRYIELSHMANSLVAEAARSEHSYAFAKAALLDIKEKLQSLSLIEEHNGTYSGISSANHNNMSIESSANRNLHDPKVKCKGRVKSKMRHSLFKKRFSTETNLRKDNIAPELYLSTPSNVYEHVQGIDQDLKDLHVS